jgi:hypothetical protein
MTASQIIEEVRTAGGVLKLRGNRIHYRVPRRVAPLVHELRRHKPDVLFLLRQDERRNASRYLLPLLGKRVWSPAGPGMLLAVEDYVTIALEDGNKKRWCDPTMVIPYA